MESVWRKRKKDQSQERNGSIIRNTHATVGVEQVASCCIGTKINRAARRKAVSLAKDSREFGAEMPADDEGVSPGGLDRHDLHRDGVADFKTEIFGSRAENHRLTAFDPDRSRGRNACAVGKLDLTHPLIDSDRAWQKIHGG